MFWYVTNRKDVVFTERSFSCPRNDCVAHAILVKISSNMKKLALLTLGHFQLSLVTFNIIIFTFII